MENENKNYDNKKDLENDIKMQDKLNIKVGKKNSPDRTKEMEELTFNRYENNNINSITSSNFDQDHFGNTLNKIQFENSNCNKILASSDANFALNNNSIVNMPLTTANNFDGSISIKSSNSGTFTIGQLKESRVASNFKNSIKSIHQDDKERFNKEIIRKDNNNQE